MPSRAFIAVHGQDCTKDVTLCAAKRGESQKGKLGLQWAEIMLAQRKIVDKIPDAAAMCLMDSRGLLEQAGFQIEHVRYKRREFRGELAKHTLIQDFQ